MGGRNVSLPTPDPWKRRRRVIYGALIFIAGNLAYLEVAPDDALHQQLALGFITAGTGIIGTYVFGAAWDDKNRRDANPPDTSAQSPE